MHLSPGTRLGRYEVRSLLGAGGMGEVYVAYDHDLEREVAVKVLRDGATEGGDRGRRFIQEAKAASALHHPNVAHVYEIGTHDDLRFIAMELLSGETLQTRLGSWPMAIDDVLEIGTQIASALAAAHKAGIVHRDIKPDNVMITHDGHEQVRTISRERVHVAPAKKSAVALPIAIAILLIAIAGVWTFVRFNSQRQPTPTVNTVAPTNTGSLSIASDPPGATIYLQRFKGPPQRARMGVTPLTIPHLERADYLLTLEKSG